MFDRTAAILQPEQRLSRLGGLADITRCQQPSDPDICVRKPSAVVPLQSGVPCRSGWERYAWVLAMR